MGAGSRLQPSYLARMPDTVIHALRQIKSELRNKVTEITRPVGEHEQDLPDGFPESIAGNRPVPHTRLALDAVQEIRIKHRWDAINAETDARENAA